MTELFLYKNQKTSVPLCTLTCYRDEGILRVATRLVRSFSNTKSMDLTSHRQDKGLSPRSSHCRLRKWKDCSNLRFSPNTGSLNIFAIVASVNAWYIFFAHYNAIMSCVQVIFRSCYFLFSVMLFFMFIFCTCHIVLPLLFIMLFLTLFYLSIVIWFIHDAGHRSD